MNPDSLTTASGAGAPPTPREHTVRLLYPFWIEAGRLERAVQMLTVQRHSGRERELKVWQETGRTPDLYKEEILPLVNQVLFGIRSNANRYLRLDPETVRHWFPAGGEFGPPDGGAAFPLAPAGEGGELFLSPHGVGFLVLTFACPGAGGLEALQTLNHRLSQLREGAAWRYRAPAGPKPPPAEAPFPQRLGGGGAFELRELAEFLLSPLKVLALQETQQQFSVYSITRFGREARFADPACRAALRPFLAALAHVEAADCQGSLDIRERALNPRHWAAVGSLGAAHLLADQDPPHPDCERLPRSLYKYFIPYLCASLQRLTLQRFLWETDGAVMETDDSLSERQAKLRRLNQDMLRFSVQGCFTEISSREVHNQYYDLALEGLRVPATLSLAQRVLGDMESATTAAFQQEAAQDGRELAREAGRNAGRAAEMQRTLEWLEVLFASYYATALVYYVGEDFFTPGYAHASLVAAPLVSGLIALLGVKPYAGRRAPGRGRWLFLGVMMVVFLAWAAVGWQQYLKESHPEQGQSFLCSGATGCARPGPGGAA